MRKSAVLNMLTQQTIDELRRLEREATPGEWVAGKYFIFRRENEYETIFSRGRGEDYEISEADENLICSTRNALPALLDELESLRNQKKCTCPTHQRGCELCLLGNPEK